MEKEHFSVDHSTSEEEPLTLPHFDDERTLQSARPVVPLHDVKRAELTRRHVFLGAALCLAAVVGAVVASLIYSQPAQPAPEAVTATIPDATVPTSADFVTPSGEASGSAVNPQDVAAPNPEISARSNDDGERTVRRADSRNRQAIARNPQVERQSEQAVNESRVQDRSELDFRAQEEMLRQQRREARRARRERRASNGLTRIREIFEGSPRP